MPGLGPNRGTTERRGWDEDPSMDSGVKTGGHSVSGGHTKEKRKLLKDAKAL